jgi:predicted nuclease with TOPRIM domain
MPIKRYAQDATTNEKEKDYQDLQKKYIAAQEEINGLRKEVGRFKDAHQSEMKKLDSLKQSLFRLLKFFDLPDHIKLHAPSDVENALSIICKELDK